MRVQKVKKQYKPPPNPILKEYYCKICNNSFFTGMKLEDNNKVCLHCLIKKL